MVIQKCSGRVFASSREVGPFDAVRKCNSGYTGVYYGEDIIANCVEKKKKPSLNRSLGVIKTPGRYHFHLIFIKEKAALLSFKPQERLHSSLLISIWP